MAHVEFVTPIDRSPADVFAILSDVEKNAKWSKTSVSGHLTSTGPVGVGTTAREVSRFMGRRIEVDSTIVAFDVDRMLAFVTNSGPFPFRGSFTVEGVGSGTRLMSVFEAQPTGVLRLADGLLGVSIRRKFQVDLANLKRLMEAGEL